jgi:ferredoxin/flavodoxin
MSTAIYYFTGTGNSLKIAKDLAAELSDAELVHICKENMSLKNEKNPGAIGFVFPVYARGLPHMVRDFAEKLDADADTYFFAVASYESSSSVSFMQLNSILHRKGAKLSASFGMAMPDSMGFAWGSYPGSSVAGLLNSQKEKTMRIAQQIKSRTKMEIELLSPNNPAMARYNTFLPNADDRNFWHSPDCNGCETCVKICPAGNIILENSKPVWQHRCESCMACFHWCPEKAIEYKKVTSGKERIHHPDIQISEMMIR